MAKTKAFRVATSGATIDGRTIDPKTLTDMAATYDPATYQARVNLEHYMSMHPESAFGAYGDVLSLTTAPVTLNVGGKDEQRLGLFAEIDAHDSLVALKDKKQKLFTSIEVTPNFAGSGKPYLSGLAFTDTPASLGTEAMKFRSLVSDASPFHFTETQKTALFSEPIEADFEFAVTPHGLPGDNPSEQTNGIMDAIKRALRGFTIVPEKPEVTPPAPAAADPAIATAFADLGKVMEQFATTVGAQAQQLQTFAADLASARADLVTARTDLTAAQAEIAAHKAALEKLPAGDFKPRFAATGTPKGGDRSAEDEIL